MTKRVAAVGTALACVVAGAAPAAADPNGPPTLAPGWWVGAYLTSSTSKDAGTIVVGISHAGVAIGSVEASGLASSAAKRRSTRLSYSGHLRVSGDATDLLAQGRIRARGHTKMMGLKVPVDRKVPGVATLHLSSATCALASGDLSGSAQLPSQMSSYDTSVKARMVLQRVDHKPSAREIRKNARLLADQFIRTGKVVHRAAKGTVTVAQLRKALAAIQALLGRTARAGSCRPTADTELHQAFALDVLKLVNARAVTAPDLLATLQMSARLGLLSNEAAGPDAAALRSSFKQALLRALERSSGPSKTQVQVAAAQYGFEGVL